jgi:asparagine synthase (glutamine-hydrolysing)
MPAAIRAFARIPGARRELIAGTGLCFARLLGLRTVTRRVLQAAGRMPDPFAPVNARLHADTVQNLRNLLHFGDRASMAYSVESRYPHLDYRLVKFWFNMPAAYKLHDGWTKYVARLAFRNRLPDRIVWRRDKMGWEIPEEYWFRGPLREWAIARLQSSDFLADLKPHSDYREGLNRERRNPRALRMSIKLLNLTFWHDVYFGSRQGRVTLGSSRN